MEPPTEASETRPQGAWHWLGRVDFAETAALQEQVRAAVIAGTGPETLLLLEHHPVITMGRSAHPTNVLVNEAELSQRGVALHRASRGGDVTYHGPGQLVGYPVVVLRRGVRAHIEGMAAALAEVLAELGLRVSYRREAPGLWVPAGDRFLKICAFGVNVHRRVAIHGFALNLDPILEHFGLIVPCGIAGCPVTSLRALTNAAPTPESVAARVAAALGSHLGVDFIAAKGAPGVDRGDRSGVSIATAANVITMVDA